MDVRLYFTSGNGSHVQYTEGDFILCELQVGGSRRIDAARLGFARNACTALASCAMPPLYHISDLELRYWLCQYLMYRLQCTCHI